MTLQSGLLAQFGFVKETTYGTYATPTTFIDFVSEGFVQEIDRIESKAIRSGQRVMGSEDWRPGKVAIKGDIELELWNKGFGPILEGMFGSVSTGSPSSGVYPHTFTPGELPSATIQIGRPQLNIATPAVTPFSYTGCVVESWELSAKVGDPVGLKVSYIGQGETTGQSLASASYPSSPELLVFTGASLTVGGTSTPVREIQISGKNGQTDDRYYLGSSSMSQPVQAELREYDGSFDADFSGTTAYGLYTAGSEAALVATFAGVANPTHKLVVTMNTRFDGETPTVGGTETVKQPMKFKCVASTPGTASTAISAVYSSTDASV